MEITREYKITINTHIGLTNTRYIYFGFDGTYSDEFMYDAEFCVEFATNFGVMISVSVFLSETSKSIGRRIYMQRLVDNKAYIEREEIVPLFSKQILSDVDGSIDEIKRICETIRVIGDEINTVPDNIKQYKPYSMTKSAK